MLEGVLAGRVSNCGGERGGEAASGLRAGSVSAGGEFRSVRLRNKPDTGSGILTESSIGPSCVSDEGLPSPDGVPAASLGRFSLLPVSSTPDTSLVVDVKDSSDVTFTSGERRVLAWDRTPRPRPGEASGDALGLPFRCLKGLSPSSEESSDSLSDPESNSSTSDSSPSNSRCVCWTSDDLDFRVEPVGSTLSRLLVHRVSAAFSLLSWV